MTLRPKLTCRWPCAITSLLTDGKSAAERDKGRGRKGGVREQAWLRSEGKGEKVMIKNKGAGVI